MPSATHSYKRPGSKRHLLIDEGKPQKVVRRIFQMIIDEYGDKVRLQISTAEEKMLIPSAHIWNSPKHGRRNAGYHIISFGTVSQLPIFLKAQECIGAPVLERSSAGMDWRSRRKARLMNLSSLGIPCQAIVDGEETWHLASSAGKTKRTLANGTYSTAVWTALLFPDCRENAPPSMKPTFAGQTEKPTMQTAASLQPTNRHTASVRCTLSGIHSEPGLVDESIRKGCRLCAER